MGVVGIIKVVIGNPIRLFLLVIRPYNSQKNFSQKNLEHIFNRAEDREEIVGNLLETDAHLKRKAEECEDNSKDRKKMLKKRRRKMLKEVFVFKLSLTITWIENLFSNKKKKIDN